MPRLADRCRWLRPRGRQAMAGQGQGGSLRPQFLANPDLPERFRLRAPSDADDSTTITAVRRAIRTIGAWPRDRCEAPKAPASAIAGGGGPVPAYPLRLYLYVSVIFS